MKNNTIFLVLLLCVLTGVAHASEMAYTPVNPNFGGSPLNGSFLLGEATANNHFKDHSGDTPPISATQSIVNQITNTVLANVATKISNQVYGENAAQSGTYQVGGSTISFVHQGQNIVLTVNDGQGGVTTVTIPAPTI